MIQDRDPGDEQAVDDILDSILESKRALQKAIDFLSVWLTHEELKVVLLDALDDATLPRQLTIYDALGS